MVKENTMKQTEIGLIPEDWELVNAEKYIDFITGFPFASDLFSKSGIRLLRGSNVKRNKIDWSDDITKYWTINDSKLRDYELKEGDIVISMDGSLVGRSFGQISKLDLPALLVQRVARVRGKNSSTNYLKHLYCSEFFTKHCDNNKTASAIPHISPKDIKEYKILIPKSLAEQEAIAAALSDCDAWIESLEKVIAKKRLIKQGAIQELLTPHSTSSGQAPEDWEVKKLGECLLKIPDYGINAAAVKYSDNLPTYLRITDIGENGEFLKSNLASVRHNLSQNYILEENDICIARTGASVGKSYFHSSFNGKLIFAGFLIRLKVDPSVLNSKLLFYITKSKKYDDFILSNSMRSGQPGINSSELQSFIISFPKSLSEQTRIATVLSDMDAELEALGQKLNKARQIKQGMMQELLTGRVRLV